MNDFDGFADRTESARTRCDTGAAVRHACRKGIIRTSTAGLAPGYAQGNLVVLPQRDADEFLRFCALNPGPCPVLGVTHAGVPSLPELAADLDIRTDLPAYRVWCEGELIEEPFDIKRYWREDSVGVVIGCSFSFEAALMRDGIGLRHIEAGTNVPMYRTHLSCVPSGRFAGPVVVSMRPLNARDARRAIEITTRFPRVHGAPLHVGKPEAIGITDLTRPDYGDPVEIKDDELPVFWACGVTPQAVIAAAKLPFAITHAPGCMLVSDLLNESLATA